MNERMEKKLFLADPNVSNGSDPAVYGQIVDAAKAVEGVTLISCEPDLSFNRTVINLMGEAEPLKQALVAICAKCRQLIDMRRHKGAHPRMGAMDVVSVYPFQNATLDDAKALTDEMAKAVYDQVGVPVYLSSENASTPFRASLQNLRRGQFEGLSQLLLDTRDDPTRAEEYAARKPDFSRDGLLDPSYGASVFCTETAIPAYYNVYIDTEDLSIAKAIAKSIRGRTGGFANIAAIGVKFEGHRGTAVSVDIMDAAATPVFRAYEFIKREAANYGVNVLGSELVGLVRLDTMLQCAAHSLQMRSFDASRIVETHLMG